MRQFSKVYKENTLESIDSKLYAIYYLQLRNYFCQTKPSYALTYI